jgi:hypothetical protein
LETPRAPRTLRALSLALLGLALVAGAAGAAGGVLRAAGAPASPQEEEEGAAQGTGAPGERILAVVDGLPISEADYRRFLVHSTSPARLREFVDRLLVEREARRLKIEVPYEEVEAGAAARLEEDLAHFGGERAAYREHLATLGFTLDDQMARLRHEALFEMALERCLLATREVSEEDVRRRYETTFGESGRKPVLRHILIRVDGPAGAPPPDEALARARRAFSEAHKSGDFAAVARQHSEDAATKEAGGLIPDYRPELYGSDVARAVERLERAGEISGIVRSALGLHIVQLAGWKETGLETVRETLRSELEARAPTADEKRAYLERLRERAQVEIRLPVPPPEGNTDDAD